METLQRHIERVVTERGQRQRHQEGGSRVLPHRAINWRSVWRSTDLDYEATRLTTTPGDKSNNTRSVKLSDLGITTGDDGARIRFVRRRFQAADHGRKQ